MCVCMFECIFLSSGMYACMCNSDLKYVQKTKLAVVENLNVRHSTNSPFMSLI